MHTLRDTHHTRNLGNIENIMSKFIIVVSLNLIAFSTIGQNDSLIEERIPCTKSDWVNLELAKPTSNNVSFYDLIDTITIIDTIQNFFYNKYLVDSIYDSEINESTLIVFYLPKKSHDKLIIGNSYQVRSRNSNPNIVMSKRDTIVLLDHNPKYYKRQCLVQVSKKKYKRDPDCIPISVDYFRVEKIKTLPNKK